MISHRSNYYSSIKNFIFSSILIVLLSVHLSIAVREYTHAVGQFRITALLTESPLSVVIVGLDVNTSNTYKVETAIIGYTLSEINEILLSNPEFARLKAKLLEVKWRFRSKFSLRKTIQDRLGRQINNLTSSIARLQHAVKETNDKLLRIHSLRYAISQSSISASSLCRDCSSSCRECPASSSVFSSPFGARFGWVPAGSFITFKLKRNETINFIEFHLYDNDSRTYTYSIYYSLDGSQWTSIRENYQGKGYQAIYSGDIEVRWLKIGGRNTNSNQIHFHYFRIDYII